METLSRFSFCSCMTIYKYGKLKFKDDPHHNPFSATALTYWECTNTPIKSSTTILSTMYFTILFLNLENLIFQCPIDCIWQLIVLWPLRCLKMSELNWVHDHCLLGGKLHPIVLTRLNLSIWDCSLGIIWGMNFSPLFLFRNGCFV